MALDVYAPCPCGSGKKLKFCCLNIADEMDRISRLIEDNQLRQALHLLEGIRRKHPENAWAVTTEALVRIEEGETLAARDSLKSFLDRHPENEFATIIYATAVLQTEGIDAARKPIHRAFQKGAKHYPAMVSGLAGAMAAVFASRGNLLAAREHLVLSMKFASERSRQEIFVRLIEFDSDVAVPYLLRSVHPLPQIPGDEAVAAEVKKAQKYAAVGCWDTAAELLAKLAETHSDVAELWHAVGLCRAWDAQETPAAAALHRAAERYSDRIAAVECEALAQLLDWSNTSARKKNLRSTGAIASVGRLLTLLDSVPRLFRMELPPDSEEVEYPQAIYQVLDRPMSECPPPSELTLDTVPKSVAQVFVYDADAETKESAEVNVVGMEGHDFDQASALVREAAGDTVTWKDGSEDSGSWVPEEAMLFTVNWIFPPGTPVAMRRKLELERWRHTTQDLWPNQPLQGLQGRTPNEAARDPASHAALAAAVYVLDTQCLRGNYELDVDGMLRRFGLEPLPTVQVTPETSLNSFTPLQWLRLQPGQLTDDQLTPAVNRAILVHHDRCLYDVLQTAVARPECLDQLDLSRVFQTLADLCRKHDRRAEAFQWVNEGRRHVQSQANAFEQLWSWDLRELLARLEDPSDPELKPLLDKFVNYYAPKLPQVRPYLEQILAAAGVESPWTASILSPAAAAAGSGGLWTPDTVAEPAAAGKLWLPGQ